ncbi:uncharacterized protein LOC112350290 isoform X1 [Selaginella moellendorffii]|uniref:uncharacterized protein LOC112350290 isoform X1 n=1 Tax=Selaginella moellendorffii TaxID=88036 RepID=UPI000D1CD06C|nr:uncharacterized protein LOC112350290 isoform X1 [Selaginella moellendorffii]|eukprot:XP_024541998.1 uncharacterized protein LOC112350290 isoform X1 [Selaginella moellendorffii]
MTDSYHLLRGRGDGDWDEPLPCCGCGVGWCSFLLGFIVPLFWYYGTFVFFFPRFQRDLRERPGFAACAIAVRKCWFFSWVSWDECDLGSGTRLHCGPCDSCHCSCDLLKLGRFIILLVLRENFRKMSQRFYLYSLLVPFHFLKFDATTMDLLRASLGIQQTFVLFLKSL